MSLDDVLVCVGVVFSFCLCWCSCFVGVCVLSVFVF